MRSTRCFRTSLVTVGRNTLHNSSQDSENKSAICGRKSFPFSIKRYQPRLEWHHGASSRAAGHAGHGGAGAALHPLVPAA